MTKRKEEDWTNREICVTLALCIISFTSGFLFLFYFNAFFGIGFVLTPSIIIIPVLIELHKKYKNYVKKRRREKFILGREQIIVGGTPQKHHHKNQRQPETLDYPVIDDETSRGKLMQELGLWYEKPRKSSSSEEKIIVTPSSSIPGRTYRQLNDLFEALNDYKRIRISHHAKIGSGHHGSSIRKMVETEAKRRGVHISVIEKGKDVIISMRKRSEKRVV